VIIVEIGGTVGDIESCVHQAVRSSA